MILLLKKLWYYGIRNRPVPGWDINWSGTCEACSDRPLYERGPRQGTTSFISKHGGKVGHCTNCGHEHQTRWSQHTDLQSWRWRSESTFRQAPMGYGWHKLTTDQRNRRIEKWYQAPLLVRAWCRVVGLLRRWEIIQ